VRENSLELRGRGPQVYGRVYDRVRQLFTTLTFGSEEDRPVGRELSTPRKKYSYREGERG